MVHPARLATQVTAEQMLEWYVLYLDEPWGEQRQDLRATASLGVFAGVKQIRTLWPYYRELSLLEAMNEAIEGE